MGAGASLDAAAVLTKEEAMAAAGDLWDEAKWEAAEKDGEGKVTAEALLAFAPAPAPAPAAAASAPPPPPPLGVAPARSGRSHLVSPLALL